MSNQSSSSVRRLGSQGANVISNRVESSIPDSEIDNLLEEGLFGLLDYGTGSSLDAEDVRSDNSSGRGALNNMVEVSRNGAYIISFTDDFERVFLSRVAPSSIRFEEFEDADGQSIAVLKCVEAEVYTEIKESEFSGVYDVLENRQRNVFANIRDSDHRERVVAALTTKERSGEIQRN